MSVHAGVRQPENIVFASKFGDDFCASDPHTLTGNQQQSQWVLQW